MRRYTDQDLWLEEDENGRLHIGITRKGNDKMGGIQYVAVTDDGSLLSAESAKAVVEFDLPFTGTFEKTGDLYLGEEPFDENKELTTVAPGYEMVGKVYTKEEYDLLP